MGLGLFTLPFSVYTLWITLGTSSTVNVFVDLLAEQGMAPGGPADALGYSVAQFVRWRQVASRGLGLVMEASIAALGSLIIHGLVDNVLYGSRGVLLFSCRQGFCSLRRRERGEFAARVAEEKGEASLAEIRVPRAATAWHWLAAFGLGLGLLLALTEGHPVAAWYANQGAIAQTRAELNLYDPERFAELEMDEVRRRADLGTAEASLLKALETPEHATAPRRLASIRLAEAIILTRTESCIAPGQQAIATMQRDCCTAMRWWPTGNQQQRRRLSVECRLPGEARRTGLVSLPAEPGVGRAVLRLQAIAHLAGESEQALERINDARVKAGLAPLDVLP